MSVGSGAEASTNGFGAAPHISAPGAERPPVAEIVRNRPEVLVGAAFAGGIFAALLLRRLGR